MTMYGIFLFSLHRNVCMYDGGSELSHSHDDISIGIFFLFFSVKHQIHVKI